jgi:hypothetical protein
MAVPLRATLRGPAGSSLATTSEPVVAPKTVGANVTPTAQVVPTSSVVAVQGEAALSVTEKGAAVDNELMVNGRAPLLVRMTVLAALVVPGPWSGNATPAGVAPRAGRSWPWSVNRVVCTQSVSATPTTPQVWAGSAGLGLMPGPWTRKKLRLARLPMTAWGVTPSLMNPAGGVPVAHLRNGPMGPPSAGLLTLELMSCPGAPSAVTVKASMP